jgi:hypothetical protein
MATATVATKKTAVATKPAATVSKKPAPKAMYNLFTGIGRLGRDPEMRYTNEGRAWVKTSLAIYQGKDKEPLWLELKAFAQASPSVPPAQSAGHGIERGGWDERVPLALAELKKGQKISVRGKLYCDKREYNGKDYVDWGLVLYHAPEVVADAPSDEGEPD